MKLYYSPASLFARKCLVVAHELGLADRIQLLNEGVHPVNRNQTVVTANPLGQVPTLITDTGQAVHDSRVICDYLNAMGQGNLIPTDDTRWAVLTEQSMADGLLAAALLCRYEVSARPEALRWSDWTQGQMQKITDTLACFESVIAQRGASVDLGTIALASALGYLDFRFADYDWRSANPGLAEWYGRFSQRASMCATAPT